MPRKPVRISHAGIATVVPSVRMVVVHVWAQGDAEGTPAIGSKVYPVLYVRSSIRDTSAYSKSDKVLLDGFESELVDHEMIHVPGCGIVAVEDAFDFVLGGPHETVLCHWPESEDLERLGPTIDRLKDQAVRLHRAGVQQDHARKLAIQED